MNLINTQRLILSIFLCIICTFSSRAEVLTYTSSFVYGDSTFNGKLKGRVIGEEGNPLPGVSVQIKGTKKGTISDSLGNFHFENMKLPIALVFSYVGHETREISVTSFKNLLVKVAASDNRLDEAVVIAYGKTTRRFNTSNIVTVDAVDIARQPVSNPLLALQGRVPGLVITPATGNAGGGVKVNIEGTTSLTIARTANDPLYVIDGIPYTAQLLPNFGNILGTSGGQFTPGQYGSPLSFINPSDIERIDILKDADATAIYGSRAANGAILITTKKGGTGELKTNVNLQTGWSKVASKLKVLDAKDYLAMRNEAFKNVGATPSSDPSSPQYAPDLTEWDTTRNIDWQKELLGKSASISKAQVSLSGGNGRTSFLASLNYNVQNSIFSSYYGGGNRDRSAAGHLAMYSSSRNSKFRSSFSVSYVYDENRLPNVDLTSVALTLSPVAPNLYSPDGTLNWGLKSDGSVTFNNPLSQAFSVYKAKTSNFLTNMDLGYDFAKYFTAKVVMGYNLMQVNDLNYMPNAPYPAIYQNLVTRSVNFSDNQINNWSVEPQLIFNKKLWLGNFEALVGGSIQQENRNGLQQNASGFLSDLAMQDVHQATSISIVNNLISQYKYAALFARVNYVLKDKYVINLSARRDGSSRFGSENRFHNFGSAAVAWLVSEESWFKNSISFVNFAKIRANYGTTGNDQIGDYAYLSSYGPVYTPTPYQGIPTLSPIGLTNPYYKWEETSKLSLGIEGGLLNSRILFNINYSDNRTKNQLISSALPFTSGSSAILQNFPGVVQNTAWEFVATSINIKRNTFRWNTSLNFTVPKNKLLKFPDLEHSNYANQYIVGQPITAVKTWNFAGVNTETGLYQVYDKQGKVTNTPQQSDLTQFINLAPRFYGGIQNSFSYKNFQLDFFFQYTEQTGLNYAVIGLTFPGYMNNTTTEVLSRWKQKGDVAPVQKVEYNGATTWAPYNSAASSNYVYVPANFLRLKNANISYNIHLNKSNSLKQQLLRVYILGQNLWTITNYTGLDPEIPNTSSLPNLRSIVIGAELTF